MLTLAAIVLAVTVLPTPWNFAAVAVAAAIDVGETLFFLHWSKRRRATVGVETFVGRRAVVVRPLSPRGGQVKLDGEVWEARSEYDVLPGEEVVVRAVEGLVLDVDPRG